MKKKITDDALKMAETTYRNHINPVGKPATYFYAIYY